MTDTLAYRRWEGMIRRCHKPGTPNYANYGARGIVVCDRWRESFQNFYTDMGECPEHHSIDRIDNDGPYSPENCRWAPIEVQSLNKRTNHRITYNGETLTLTEWAKRLGTTCTVLANRLRRGWTEEQAVSIPLGQVNRWNAIGKTPVFRKGRRGHSLNR